MRIGKQDQAFSAIATSDEHSITVRGHDLCDELIGRIGFTDYLWLLVTGERASEMQRKAADACLVAIAEHGLVPSVQAARMTLAAGPDAWQGAMAAGLLGMGSVVAGSSEVAGHFIVDVLSASRENGDLDGAAKAALGEIKAARSKVPGFGHPQHSAGDPRANRLLEIADELGIASDHIRTLRVIADHAPDIIGRPLPINVSGAIPAVLLDAGWPAEAMKAIPLIARAAGLAAHLFEETHRSIGFIMSNQADQAIAYDGETASTGSQDAK